MMRSRGQSFFLYLLPSIVWTVVLLALMVSPASGYPSSQVTGSDLVIHFFLFGIWGFLMCQGFYKQAHLPVLKFHRGFFALGLGALLAFGTEAVQGFFLWDRAASIWDYVADIAGVLVGLQIFEKMLSQSRNR